MEEEDDRNLLSSLGVTSANPDDVERDVLAEVYVWFSCYFIVLFLICVYTLLSVI